MPLFSMLLVYFRNINMRSINYFALSKPFSAVSIFVTRTSTGRGGYHLDFHNKASDSYYFFILEDSYGSLLSIDTKTVQAALN